MHLADIVIVLRLSCHSSYGLSHVTQVRAVAVWAQPSPRVCPRTSEGDASTVQTGAG